MSNPKERAIIVFGEDWGRHPSSTQHLITHLSKNYQIIWINSIGLRQPTLSFRDLKRIAQKLKDKIGAALAEGFGDNFSKPATQLHNESTPKKVSANFPVISPLTIPAPKSALARTLAKHLLKWQINKVTQSFQFTEITLWLSLPTAVDMIGSLGEKHVIYYCGDDFGALAGVDHQTAITREQELQHKADLILAVSQKLVQRFPKDKTLLLPHGVDFDLFSQPTEPHPILADDARPTAGFYGSLSEWLNTELIIEVAHRLPDWRFVFVGKPDIDIAPLIALDNIEHYPAVSHSELPRFSQHWTVSILPFRDSEQIRACNPLKLREYLATGRPVVSTWYPALKPYEDVIQIANDANAFCAALKQANAGAAPYGKTIQDKVVEETWEARAALIEARLRK